MSTAENKAIVLRFLEEFFNQEHEAVWDELVHPDVVIRGVAATLHGEEEAKSFLASLKGALHPHFTIEDIITEGEKVVVRLIESGAMMGSFMGLAPTGRSYTLDAVQICRLADGKLAEMWGFRDTGSQMRQLGLVPPPQPTQSQT